MSVILSLMTEDLNGFAYYPIGIYCKPHEVIKTRDNGYPYCAKNTNQIFLVSGLLIILCVAVIVVMYKITQKKKNEHVKK